MSCSMRPNAIGMFPGLWHPRTIYSYIPQSQAQSQTAHVPPESRSLGRLMNRKEKPQYAAMRCWHIYTSMRPARPAMAASPSP